ncbi:efflux RND transporter periplasmic adaptor subunit [Pedobacter gandavensis]|uniref:HlyD family efflux transporter periplasmic adaptor subunit n=1 Tax=Pedobacter gandavensis TaxID=2679963 RepID=A0ABR6EYP1_9SPHI|nr:HlyD family efflux transporter periplasmic adaptor subunit [Pedobacter gandavensis]MBB2150076.1 HlyD family efflux transporter periplasmic adaptor subunit [Pedobacter gandavensis]
MDRNIEQAVSSGKKKKLLLYLLIGIVLLVAGIFGLRRIFNTTLYASEITTSVVDRGNIENTINASGEVLPEFEEVISSPIAASIQKVLLDGGSKIQAGQSILTLDKSAAQMDFEKLKFQLESKKNDIRKIKLDLDKSFYDIKSNNDIKQLRINSLKASVDNTKRLLKAGGGTREDVEQAELNLKVAQLEKQQLENEINSKQQSMRLQMREVELAANIQQNDLDVLQRKLQQADITASRNGVVTWVNKNIGAAVQPGEVLARIADLSSFKVKGTISDQNVSLLKNGMTAIIRIGENQVRGKVVNIYPAIQNATVSFDIKPDSSHHKLFRPNLKADVFLVTDEHQQVLRVSNGPAFLGTPSQSIFVLKDGVAIKKNVQIGLSNFDFVELKDQVKEGDVVITSDMHSFKNSNQITIKK